MQKQPMPYRKIVFVCTNQRLGEDRPSCGCQRVESGVPTADGNVLRDRLKDMVKEHGLRGRIRVSKSGCMDRCEYGPNIMVMPDNTWYSGVREEDLEAIFAELVESLREQDQLPRRYEERDTPV